MAKYLILNYLKKPFSFIFTLIFYHECIIGTALTTCRRWQFDTIVWGIPLK
ncbi:hypothetical protein HMPREF3226_00552 [Prevotella corporis]|uniref:Uncharacterized protein n=1 Tax=Prevotella corporis TaxID=28128 RepID=A0A133QJG4_9BACT|nr:hypothetical protein HMPREF3226_00552 [Prevotella corporis]